ncbi:hypothetical protein [[Clostridium] innocuum]|jgi:hypothetical protein|uniref:hypothetical protein n=1 Tax=Clostridium innocuum TaxID=1522 RepID=UPI0022E0AB21|nr:hypothetical protein [[Clostridium] innocuum]
MYATPEYYTADYGGTLISQDELPKALKDAEYSIDHLCFGRIKGKGFDNLSPYQQELIRRAVCLQADYIKQYGPYINSPLKGYSAGSTKVEMANVTYGGISTTQEIINLLEDTGLRCLVL